MSKLAVKAVPVMGQISAFLDGAPVAFDELGAVTAAEKRAWKEARRIAQTEGKGEALLFLFRHGTVDRNKMLIEGASKAGRAAFGLAQANTAGRIMASPLGRCRHCGHHYPDEHRAKWGRSLRLCSNPACADAEKDTWARKKRDRLDRKIFRPGSPEDDWMALNNGAKRNGKGKLRWEAFAEAANRGDIVISFWGGAQNMQATISAPGQPDRHLGGPGVIKLAKRLRKVSRHHPTRPNGMTMTRPSYPFAEKEELYRDYSDSELHFALADATEARDAMSTHNTQAEAWYADDVHTILGEMRRRGLSPQQARSNTDEYHTGAGLARPNSNSGTRWYLALSKRFFPAGSVRGRTADVLDKNVVSREYLTEQDAWQAYHEHSLENYFDGHPPLVRRIPRSRP